MSNIDSSGMSSLERVMKKIWEVRERFQAIQQNLPEIPRDGDKKPDGDATFRSALHRAQERQSTDGTTKDATPVSPAAPMGAPRASAADRDMEKRLMETLKRELPKYNVPPDLALAVMQAESNFNPRAVSPKGAIGVMQIMPSTAKGLGVEDAEDLFDPEVNIPTGLQYLSTLMSKYKGNERMALAAYNAGPGAVAQHGGVPPFAETRDYIKRVFEIRQKLNDGSSS